MTSLDRPRTILRWLALANKRGRSSLASLSGNNLNYTAMALLFMLDPAASVFLLLLMGLIVLLPLSADPLRAIPRVRLHLWPLSPGERRILRLASPWLSPMTWVVMALALWRRASTGLVALAVGIVAVGFLAPASVGGSSGLLWRWLPQFPRPLNQLIRKNLRQMLSTLDFCCGALLAVAALAWRAFGLLPPEAFFPFTMIATLAISTCALNLFGLDGSAGMTRYRLMPVRGWQLLLAKDAAYFMLALILSAPLSLPAGLAAALVALAVGHRTSVLSRRPQMRWRFQTGPSLGDAMAQIIAMIIASAAVVYRSPWLLLPCLAAWAGSLWWFGREFDRV